MTTWKCGRGSGFDLCRSLNNCFKIRRQEQTEPAIQVGLSALYKHDLTFKLLKHAIYRNYQSYLVLDEICTNPTTAINSTQ